MINHIQLVTSFKEEYLKYLCTQTGDCAICGDSEVIVLTTSMHQKYSEASGICSECIHGWISAKGTDIVHEHNLNDGTNHACVITLGLFKNTLYERYDLIEPIKITENDKLEVARICNNKYNKIIILCDTCKKFKKSYFKENQGVFDLLKTDWINICPGCGTLVCVKDKKSCSLVSSLCCKIKICVYCHKATKDGNVIMLGSLTEGKECPKDCIKPFQQTAPSEREATPVCDC